MSYNIGDQVELEDIKVYPTLYAKNYKNITSGTYYIYSDKIRNNRIRITKYIQNIDEPGHTAGFVNIDDLNKDPKEFYPGDKVIVNGTINKEPDGSGYSIYKKEDIMYITDILDESYRYNIGLSDDVGKSRLAYGNKSIIKKYKSNTDI